MDSEKVIKGLECCAVGCRSGCPYFDIVDDCEGVFGRTWDCYIANDNGWINDRRDDNYPLKSNEARVMTLEEVKQHNNQDGCVWFEQPTYNADAAFVLKDDFMTQVISPYILGDPINHGYWANGNYGKTWRCWTSRPTDEQREATPWES